MRRGDDLEIGSGKKKGGIFSDHIEKVTNRPATQVFRLNNPVGGTMDIAEKREKKPEKRGERNQ